MSYYILINNDRVVGFYEASIIFDEAELFDIAVIEEFQGKKLSVNLLKHFINECMKRNVRTIFLEVNNNNTKAINLYNKFKFKEYSIRKNYYGENDAILMKLELN